MSGPMTVSVSGGRTSALMLRRLMDAGRVLDNPACHVLFANTGREREETLEFVRDLSRHWGVHITWLEWAPRDAGGFRVVTFETASRQGEPFEALIRLRRFLPNPVTRFCTQELKVRPMREFMKAQGFEHWTNCVGIRADEPRRVARMRQERPRERFDVELPLADAGVTVSDVNEFWSRQPFTLRLQQHEGNCDLCFLKRVGDRVRIANERPDLAAWWHRMESETGGTFRKEGSLAQLQALAARRRAALEAQQDLFTCFCGDDAEETA